MAKLKLGYRVSPTLQASYTLGIWQNVSDGSVDSYLRDAAGNTVYNAGSSYANPFKFVRIDGKDYTVSAAVPSRSESEHWMHGLALTSNTGGAWDYELVASLYDQKKDISRTAVPTVGTDNGLGATRPPGTITYADGTGWQNADLRGTWRSGGAHTLNFGVHHDRYELVNNSYNDKAVMTDWLTADPDRSKKANAGSYGVTQTDALYLQDDWRFAPDWTLLAGVRQEQWQASGGLNRTTTTGASPVTTDLVYAPRSYSHLSPKLHLAWQASPALNLKASLGHAVRYPTVSEMFQTYSNLENVKVNDPNLKPEQMNSLELVALQQWPNAMLRASYFREDKSDALISQRIAGATSTVTTNTIQNVDEVQTEGLELAFGERDLLVSGLELNGSVTYTHSLITKDTAWPVLAGTVQPRIPDWRATLVATYRASEALSYSLTYRYSGRQHNSLASQTTGQYADVNPDVYGAVSHYSVFDAKLLYRINRQWTGSVGVNNIGNFKYYVNPNPYPQRTLFASVKYDL
jgi:iron complex outermembrane recepter protein